MQRHADVDLGIARTKNLNGPWTVDAEPILPAEEQLENASLYYEPTNRTWFLFTNHIAILDKYCDAVWVYWSKDVNQWDRHHKAVVVDGKNCTWSKQCIGVPSVIPYKGKLAVFYDAPGGDSRITCVATLDWRGWICRSCRRLPNEDAMSRVRTHSCRPRVSPHATCSGRQRRIA